MEIIVLGQGSFGSALASHFKNNGFKVFTVNKKASWPENLTEKHVVFLCVPTQKLPEALAQRANNLIVAPYVVSTCKGLLENSLLTPTQLMLSVLKNHKGLVALSGPSFAAEIEKNLPTALVLACENNNISQSLCKTLSAGNLRFYINNDPVGVEYCGALKNIYAILAGISFGLDLGENARASLNTRALAEMTRFVKALGADPLTVFGLAGVGDLFLTCSSVQSRNFRFGVGLARGEDFENLLEELGTVEGFWTSFVAHKLAHEKNVRAPLIDVTVALLMKKLSFEDAFSQLIAREVRGEFE